MTYWIIRKGDKQMSSKNLEFHKRSFDFLQKKLICFIYRKLNDSELSPVLIKTFSETKSFHVFCIKSALG